VNQPQAQEPHPLLRPQARSSGSSSPEEGERTRIVVRPEDVLQPDRRPWARLTLEGVVARAVLFSAVLVTAFLLIVAGGAKLLGLW